jgi:hypothetical protein
VLVLGMVDTIFVSVLFSSVPVPLPLLVLPLVTWDKMFVVLLPVSSLVMGDTILVFPLPLLPLAIGDTMLLFPLPYKSSTMAAS